MYFGSVRFYKHLIYTVLVIISILAIIGLVFLISLIIPRSDVHAADINYNDSITANSNNAVNPNDNNFSNNYNVNQNNDKDENESTKENISSPSHIPNPNTIIGDGLNGNHGGICTTEENIEISDEKTEIKGFDLYPELVCEIPVVEKKSQKTAYLTFDDGPSTNTLAILDVLKKYDVKATFFVVTGSYNSSNLYLLNNIVEQGHAIGIHSNTHEYTKIYESLNSYLEDLDNAYNAIYKQTGIKANIVRLPGGSINSFNEATRQQILDELLDRNFRYYDWNVSFQDAKKNIKSDEIISNALNGINKFDGEDLIILAHDNASNETSLALEKVIEELKERGYEFDIIDNTVEPITFSGK